MSIIYMQKHNSLQTLEKANRIEIESIDHISMASHKSFYMSKE